MNTPGRRPQGELRSALHQGPLLHRLRGLCRRAAPALRRGVASIAATLALGTAAAASAAGASAWPVQDSAAPSAEINSAAQAAGWACTQAVALPGSGRMLLACRESKGGSGSLQLLEMTSTAGGKTAGLRVLGGLGDASAAYGRVFSAPQPCPAGGAASCLAALVLVDHRDEGSCYGTLVYAAIGDKPLQRLGMLNEVLRAPGADAETCVAAAATLASEAAAVRITLQGPLWRIGRDGVSRALRSTSVVYRARAQPLSLKRAG